jgi:hypothetical protein
MWYKWPCLCVETGEMFGDVNAIYETYNTRNASKIRDTENELIKNNIWTKQRCRVQGYMILPENKRKWD